MATSASVSPLATLRALLRAPRPAAARAYATSSSSKRWLNRQSNDPYTAKAKLEQLRSRAAFKLLEINTVHKILAKGQTVVDLVPRARPPAAAGPALTA